MATGKARDGRLVLVMGSDLAGVDDRWEQELEAMRRPGDAAPGRFPDVAGATAYLASCSLFDPSPAIGVSDCAEAMRANAQGRRMRDDLVSVLAANPSAAVAIRLGKRPGGTKAEDDFVSALRGLGCEVARVDVPGRRARVPWLMGYAERHGVALGEGAASLVLDVVGDGDASIAAELVRSLGEELNLMGRDELLGLVPAASESTYTRIRQAIVDRDAERLRQCRHELPEGPSGDRTFATKSRYALQRLLIASCIGWDRKDVLAHGRGEYGDRYAGQLISEAARSGGRGRYARAYARVSGLVTAMTGFGDGSPATMDALMGALTE